MGLIDPIEKPKINYTVETWCEHYIADRTDLKQATIVKLKNTARLLQEHVGADKLLTAVTPGDAERFGRSLREKFASSHAGKIIKNCRQIWAAAIKDRLLAENPFEDVSIASKPKDRKAYIPREHVDKLLEQCPDTMWRVIVVLARYGGFRVPSEILKLKWTDINWDTGRITITSPKTEHHEGRGTRVAPLFPELRKELETLHELVPDHSVYVCYKYRSGNGGPFRNGLERSSRRLA